MKKYLIDTQILIWAILGDEKLSDRNQKLLENSQNEIFISQITLIEIAIKSKLNKLPNFNYSINQLIDKVKQIDFQILPIKNDHINTYNSIKLFDNHRDPFDRLIISTSVFENIPIISADEKFKNYTDIIELIDNQN